MRKKPTIAFSAIVAILAASISFAMYEFTSKGVWPDTWPKELEPLRDQSRTLSHSLLNIHEIPFTDRGEFESAWPHILSIKSKEAPLILLSSPHKPLGKTFKAAVRILSPLTGSFVNPEGGRYPPGTKSAIPVDKFLRIGPPWPDSIKSESGTLPEYVVPENGRWAPFAEKEIKFGVRRSRVDIELIVDGDIIDLNRIPLPADTPIIDKRFQDIQSK